MKVSFSAAASNDLDEAFEYVAADSLRAALSLVEAVSAATDRLAEVPFQGRPGKSPGTRELVIRRTSYVAVYEIEGDTVLILRIMHGARRWPPA